MPGIGSFLSSFFPKTHTDSKGGGARGTQGEEEELEDVHISSLILSGRGLG
jgi:hypothetical protein